MITPESSVLSPTPFSNIDTSDAALLNHFVTSTASTLSTNPATKSLWENHVPFLAKSHLFLYRKSPMGSAFQAFVISFPPSHPFA